MTLQYLESFDSVRSGPAVAAAEEERHLAELQALLETVLALSLGRSVAVPYSYAFDSAAFLRVAQRVLTARRDAAPDSDDLPFRLHLHGKPSFDVAVQEMIDRAGEQSDPFVSSLYPELNWTNEEEREALPRDIADLQQATSRGAADRLELVRNEFARRRAWLPGGRSGGGPGLAAAMDEVTRLSPEAVGLGGDDELGAAFHRLRRAIRELRPATLGQRSRLRRPDLPWPGDDQRRLLAEIVDEAGRSLLGEFVDTFYNRVVFESMGQGSAAFSTTAGKDVVSAEARLLAQRLALRPSGLAVPVTVGDEQPMFEVFTTSGEFREDSPAGRAARSLLGGGSSALGPLLAARAEPREKSDFWRSVDQVNGSAANGDERAFDKALDSHFALVTKLLPATVQVGSGPGGRVLGAAGFGGTMLTAVADVVWQLPTGPFLSVSAVAGGAALTIEEGYRVRRWAGRRSVARALGDYVRGDGDR